MMAGIWFVYTCRGHTHIDEAEANCRLLGKHRPVVQADKVDPGVSRLHAVLASASDGTWFISDPGSANGTFVNNRELDVGERITLHEGDRINLGAWTVITVHRG